MRETRVQSLSREDPLEKEMATYSSTLAWKIHGRRSLGGCSPWGRRESDTTERLHFHFPTRKLADASRTGILLKSRYWKGIVQKVLQLKPLPSQTYVELLHNLAWIWVPSAISSVQSLSCVQLFATPWTAACRPPVRHQLPEFTETHLHWVGDDIQPSHPLSSSSPPAFNLSQHQGLFKWVSSSHQVAKVLEFQLQHQSFQWTPRTDLL